MSQQWSGKTDGTPNMQKALIVLFRYMDVRVMYAVMAVVILFYMLLKRQGYLAQYHYFHTCYGQRPLKAFVNVYRNHYQFGQVVLDRFAAYAGRTYKFIYDDKELFDRITTKADGVLLLSSHVGNFEMSGYHLTAVNKKIYSLVFAGETAVVQANKARMLAEHNIYMIPVANDMSHIYTMKEVLDAGEIVNMPADRQVFNSRTIVCDFFGRKAEFPLGPFRLATVMNKHVLAIWVMKEQWDTYRIIVKQLTATTAQALAQQYADALEKVVSHYPLQWYHYYDFWNKKHDASTITR